MTSQDDAIQQQFAQLEAQVEAEKTKYAQLYRDYSQVSAFANSSPQDSLQWRLDPSVELERIEHLLRADRIVRDSQGNEDWEKAFDPASRVVSDHGIDLIMEVLSFIINKNIILSEYEPEEINQIMLDFVTAINDVFLNNYEDIFYCPPVEELIERDLNIVKDIEKRLNVKIPAHGKFLTDELQEKINSTLRAKIETLRKKTIRDYQIESQKAYEQNCNKYDLLINLIEQGVLATYHRALWGGEAKRINKSWHVTESINTGLNQRGMPQQMPQHGRKQWSVLKPWTWGRI